MASYADFMYELLKVVEVHGAPQVVAGDGTVIIYAQTSDILEGGYFPVYKDGFPEAEVDRIIQLGEDAGQTVYYDKEYADSYTDTTFTAFELSPL